MVNYTITGITEPHAYTVSVGSTPNNTVFYNQYSSGTTSVTITGLTYNTVYYVALQDTVTNFKRTMVIKTASAYCANVCDTAFSVTQIAAPTPTPTITPSITPTISLTPSKTPSVTPTKTPNVAISPTPTITPSLTPSVSVSSTAATVPPVESCGEYTIYYVDDSNTRDSYVDVYYTSCENQANVMRIWNSQTRTICAKEMDSEPIISYTNVSGTVEINRIGNCYSPPLT